MPFKDPEKRKAYHREYMRQRYQADDGFRKTHRRHVKKSDCKYRPVLRQLLSVFKANGCLLCPERTLCCLVAHHVDPETKEFGPSYGVTNRVSPARMKKELQKCVCVCMNCHAKLHAGVLKLPQRSKVGPVPHKDLG